MIFSKKLDERRLAFLLLFHHESKTVVACHSCFSRARKGNVKFLIGFILLRIFFMVDKIEIPL